MSRVAKILLFSPAGVEVNAVQQLSGSVGYTFELNIHRPLRLLKKLVSWCFAAAMAINRAMAGTTRALGNNMVQGVRSSVSSSWSVLVTKRAKGTVLTCPWLRTQWITNCRKASPLRLLARPISPSRIDKQLVGHGR